MPKVVAFQGENGAFSWEAISRHFGQEAEPFPCKSFRDVFELVNDGKVDLGLVPVENSQAGTVNDVYDLLRQYDLNVTGEVCHPVNLCLMALPGQALADLHRVISHPVALAQCDQYLHQMGVEIVATYDTAGSAKMIREGNLQGVGAVAGAGAADLYALQILARKIQTVQENVTRFVVLSRTPAQKGQGPHKTMLVMAVSHSPGSLYRALGALAERGINLSKLESRPSKNQPWEYVFYLDFAGHREDQEVREALAEMTRHTSSCKVFGSFSRNDSSEGWAD